MIMILGHLTVARCNIATVNMAMHEGVWETEKHNHSFDLPLFFNMSKQFVFYGPWSLGV